MKNIVSMRWLLARMYESDVAIVDCRFLLGQPDAGREAYEAGHIPGAVYLDLEKDLSAPVTEHGGRHPLPDPTTLASRLAKAGIGSNSRIIAYDDQGGMNASRLWWLLRYLGHEQVYVMDEGFSAWKNAKFPMATDVPVQIPSSFEWNLQPQMLASVEEAQHASASGSAMLIDSRDARRYAGLEEPIDAKAGHIPGAVNYFWKDVLGADGRWSGVEALEERFVKLGKDDAIIVYCGSGVSACPNVIALEEAGFSNVKLYSGSWSDWISYEGNAVATEEE
ncbi:thiosulfate/3-mercaptopyruvate sulfurtransferase [Paenibacillus polysaccharolyticus]|uniref:Thiosulfate/3-mercaptopyruvate sulfurtransferase n=1 Tax=Paenibacillus polysaccharolyticus TaxID=582692 RepID=A0A1G5B1T8_9BACL|nr:sulfurtransferase [Paenibacillus polysaccharolyticus]SCX84056.1 thiosulfate/3-mercaptopyruvate sulfurtransferase [Paenibacillus polysaccharolyticus]